MDSPSETLMHLIYTTGDSKVVAKYLSRASASKEIKINKICSNRMTLIGAAAQTGSINLVKCLLEFSKSKSDQLPLDIRNDNHPTMRLELSKSTNGNVSKKKQNIGYFYVCRETEELGEGPTPDGMEGLEWDMEVDDRPEQPDTPSQLSEKNLYHWYADILSRTAVILESEPELIEVESGDRLELKNLLHLLQMSQKRMSKK